MRRQGSMTHEQLEDIYELTYKYQMLKQEAAIGDYGTPSQLPDRAYMEFEKIKPALNSLLDDAHPEMIETYEVWLDDHNLDDDRLFEQESESLREAIGDPAMFDRWGLSEAAVRAAIAEGLGFNTHDLNIQYLDRMVPTDYAYNPNAELLQAVQTLPLYELVELPEIGKNYEDISAALFYRIPRRTMQEIRKEHEEETAFGSVKDMYRRLRDEWPDSLDAKITMFQEALTTAHNSGSMAEYLLRDPAADSFLDDLSEGPQVEQWNRDLQKMLGYDLGSHSIPKSDWFVPANLRRACRILEASATTVRLRYSGDAITWINQAMDEVALEEDPELHRAVEELYFAGRTSLDEEALDDLYTWARGWSADTPPLKELR